MSTADDPENLVGRLREAMEDEQEEVDEVPPVQSDALFPIDELKEAISNLSTQVTSLSSVCLSLVDAENSRRIEADASFRQKGMREARAIMWGKPIYVGPVVIIWDSKRRTFPRKRSWKFWKK